jgi:hypothetical protein
VLTHGHAGLTATDHQGVDGLFLRRHYYSYQRLPVAGTAMAMPCMGKSGMPRNLDL